MIRIQIEKKRPNFRPGEAINGIVQWQEVHGDVLEIRLVWYTAGDSGGDAETVAIHKIAPLQPAGRDPFQFTAPHRPLSYDGKLFSVNWALEALVFPAQAGLQLDLVISNTGKVLKPHAASSKK